MFRTLPIRLFTFLGLLVCLVVALFIPYEISKASDDADSAQVWIPLVESGKLGDGGNEGDNPPPPPPAASPTPSPTSSPAPSATPSPTPSSTPSPTPPPAAAEPWAFFVDMDWKTSSASIVTDAAGGMHLAYVYYEATGDGAPTSGVYLYCATDCDDTTKWNGVQMGEVVKEIQVALTPNGEPRILYRVSEPDSANGYYYAECNSDCTNPAQWGITPVATTRGMAVIELSDDELPQRYFALDNEGRPRFVYTDRDTWREPDHLGTYYAFCDSHCTDAANWFETRINKDNGNEWVPRSEKFYYPSLAFTPAGQPRVVAEGTSMQDEAYLYYVACDEACGNADNWQSAPLSGRGSGVYVSDDVELDAEGRPRIAFYEGAQLEGKGDRLWYGWCDQGCTDATNWNWHDLGLATGEGQAPDLVLDATGKPHIAYGLYAQGGVAYGWCESDCESTAGQWKHQVVESGSDLLAAWSVAYPPHCDGGFWDGRTPTLSLDENGNALFAYDATYHARCWYDDVTDQWEPFSQIQLIKRIVRTYFLPKP